MLSLKEKDRRKIGYDAAALLLGSALLAYFLFTAKLGFGSLDEGAYYTIAQRIILGERLFLEEWNLAQLASLFSVIPLWIYTKITGGTEGLILYMRYVFIAINTVFYAYMYKKLRNYKLWGLLAAFMFCAIVPEAIFAIDYYTVSSMAVMAVCLELHCDKKEKSGLRLVLTGMAFAFGVLAEPVLVFIYGVYLIAVIVWNLRRKKNRGTETNAYLLSVRTFGFLTMGAFLCFIAFIALLLWMGSLQELYKTLPYLFTGTDINFASITDFAKYLEAVRLFGPANIIGLSVCIAAAVWYSFSKKRSDKLKYCILAVSALLFCGCCVCAWRSILMSEEKKTAVSVFLYHGVPVLFISPVWYLLSRRKDPRLFTVLLVGILYSALIDTASSVVLAGGSRIAFTAGILQLGTLLPEIRTELQTKLNSRDVFRGKSRWRKRLLSAFAAVIISVFSFWELMYIGGEGVFKPLEKYTAAPGEKAFGITLQAGPQKNLRTSEAVADAYYRTLHDIDTIRRESHGEPLYISVIAPYLYLHAGLPYGDSSASNNDPIERRMVYWDLFESQKPGYIYLSQYRFNVFRVDLLYEDYLQSEISEISGVFVCEVTKGEGGYILKVLKDA